MLNLLNYILKQRLICLGIFLTLTLKELILKNLIFLILYYFILLLVLVMKLFFLYFILLVIVV
jgi:hypothetical protein